MIISSSAVDAINDWRISKWVECSQLLNHLKAILNVVGFEEKNVVWLAISYCVAEKDEKMHRSPNSTIGA
jgi:hypothetical protein